MSETVPIDPLQELLDGLNEPQRIAVLHGEGPLLVLAGAGSGKTRVLTHRIAALIRTGQARPNEILAITFTNKAAQEMRERVELLLGHSTRAMWVMTFHAACARILRVEAPRLGYTRQFTIYDSADQRRLIKRCIDEVDADPKRFTPAAVQHQISDAKSKLRDSGAYRQMVGSFYEQTIADVYEEYERQLHSMNAMDFDDLLCRVVNVLELFPEVRARYAATFRHILVDEYQDTNHAQYRLLQLLAGGDDGHRNLMVVGDDAQCLIEGTLVTMADGSTRPIEAVEVGDEVLSSYGSGDFRPARVTETFRSERRDAGIAITLASGRRIVSTSEHTHFAGPRRGTSPQMHLPFGVRRSNIGCRVNARQHALVGGPGGQSTFVGPEIEMHDLTITLCGDHRGRTAMHRVAVAGRDPHVGEALREAGFSVRPGGQDGWRIETCFSDFEDAQRMADGIARVTAVSMRYVARLGAKKDGQGNSLPFMPASSVRPGMVMFNETGDFDVVETVERVALDRPVYDLNIEGTHNFIAGGVLTHNSVYSFRGADIRNLLDFQDDFPDAVVVKLEQNYRSTQTILNAANAIIAHNRAQLHKTLWTEIEGGDPIIVRELEDEHAEARYVVGEIERLVDEGVSRAEIAIFYRTNAQSRVLEDTLVRREIAYQVIGGTKFYERAEVKDAMAYLTILGNPQDVVSFTRVANSPRRGIGQTSLSRVISHAATMGENIWDIAANPASVPGLGAAAVKSLGRFMETMEGLHARLEQEVPIGDLLEAVLHESGYLDALEAERTIEAEGRIENLGALVEAAREFDAAASEDEKTLDVFLQQTALIADADGRQDDEGLVTLMTLHNAKGLEYPIVFMIGCEEGVFPHSRSIEEGSLEEERRLMYVGVTRAMRGLYLTYARRRAVFGGAPNYGLPSRFLAELPPDLVDRQGSASTWASASVSAGTARPRAMAWAATDNSASSVSFRMGEDVVHAAFGEGVVTGVESGGVIVVRFATDGSERKLMADYAPITKP